MPITVTAPAGILTRDRERTVAPRPTAALLDVSGGVGNDFFASLVGDIVDSTRPEHDSANIWVKVIKAPDGGWGVAGRAYTGDAGHAVVNSVIDPRP